MNSSENCEKCLGKSPSCEVNFDILKTKAKDIRQAMDSVEPKQRYALKMGLISQEPKNVRMYLLALVDQLRPKTNYRDMWCKR